MLHLDTTTIVETPEAIGVVLHPANVFARARAFALDLLIRTVVFVVIGFFASFVGAKMHSYKIVLGVLFLCVFALMWLYPVVFEVWNNGQTPGKRVFGLRVVTDTGATVGFGASLVRNIMRTMDALPFGYALGMVCMLMHPAGKRLGDVFAGTLVVYSQHSVYPSREAFKAFAPVRPPVALSLAEQDALLSFAERYEWLSAQRRLELAQIWLPILEPGAKDPVSALMGMARYLIEGKDA